MDIKKSTILITGGTSGIGLELVKQLTDEGAVVIVTGRNLDALNATKERFPMVHTFQSDVSKLKDIEQLFQVVTSVFPNLNMVINNAGEMRLLDLTNASINLENVNREIAINLTGTIQMVQKFLPHLLKQREAGIINVSSAIAFMPYSVAPIYSASKAGVRFYTQALRQQLDNTSVRVFELIPSGTNTSLQDDWIMPPNPRMMMDVDKLVSKVVRDLKNDRPELKPSIVGIIKLLSRLMPGALLKFGGGDLKKFRAIKQH
jgi:uncharacterized oxidoreductase